MYGKYHLYKKQLSWDSGATWYDSDPLVTVITGDPVATYETLEECIGGIYRWVVVSGGYECSGTTKMTQEKEQVSYDSGTTWTDVTPIETRAVLPVIEYNSEDCGYTPFNGRYKLTLKNSNTITALCNSTSAITSGEVATQYSGTVASAEIGKCVTSIGDETFIKCSGLTSITLSNSVTNIGNYAFANCGIINIVIPNNVTSIGTNLFACSEKLTNAIIGSGITTISMRTFMGCDSLTSVTIPNSVTSIGESAFNGCASLTGVTIPSGVTTIGSGAFMDCYSLASIELPNGLTNIGNLTFSYCSGLTYINIPSSVSFIDHSAFRGCTNLVNIAIPSGVTSIGNFVFSGCTSLTSITCLATTPPSIGYYVFDSTPIESGSGYIYVPSASVDAYKSATRWSDFSSRIRAIPGT